MFRILIKSAGAAAALAATVSLTACGPLQLGAAAVVGTQRISTSTLSGDVADLNAAYQAHPALQSSVQYTTAQMPQLVLAWLVRFLVLDDIARQNGVQVTDAQARNALATAFAQIQAQTGKPAGPGEFAVLAAVPPKLTPLWGRFRAAEVALLRLYTGAKDVSSLTAEQQQTASGRFAADVAAAVKRLNIRINPRFGELNPAQLSIVNASDRLSKPESS